MPSAFEELCEQRNVLPEEWKKSLSIPIIPDKCPLDMTEEELEDHYKRVEERAENTKEDRALIILERTQEGRLERQARKVFNQNANEGVIVADQVPEMLETLRYELTNTEVHYLLRKFDATDDFDMIPEKELNKKQWMWLVGECQMLKNCYGHLNPEAWEVCYETMVQNRKVQRDAGLEGTDEWPHIEPTGPNWWWNGGTKPGYDGPLKGYVWGLPPEEEEALLARLDAEDEEAKNPQPAAALQIKDSSSEISSSETTQ